jgi:hypothetical protein
MRTKTLLLTAALSVAGIASSMAQAVYSVNAVGYVNTDLVPGFNLISNPLNNTTGNTIQNLFANGIQGTIPNNLTVYHFNPTTDSFVTAVYDDLDAKFIPDAAAATVIAPGNGVFVRNPTQANVRVTFVGEVPQGAASNTDIPQGFSIKASTVPVAGTVASMNLPAVQGDRVFEWNSATQAFVTSAYDDLDQAWLPAPANLTVGEAFFIFKTAAATWTRNFNVNQ